MFAPHVMQVVVLAAVFRTVRSSSLPCFDESHLEERAQKKLRHLTGEPSDPQPRSTTPARCPVGLYADVAQHTDQYKDRSISPWRIVYDTNQDRFPHTIAVAQCLCGGCITISEDKTPTENFTYNSVEIVQSRVVLKKERCADGKKYRLVPHTEPVPVGCTCVRPKN